jgi:signal transduction protein with GAF and PtsI domain
MDPLASNTALDFLHDVGTRLAAADPLHEVLDRIVEFVSDLVSCDSCLIYVLDGNDLVLRASKNPHPEEVDRLTVRVGQGITGWVAEHLEPVALERNASQDGRFRSFAELPEDHYQALLSVPVISRGRVVSVINVQHKEPHAFQPREVKMISMIGHLVGAAIEMARLENEVIQLSDKLAVRKIIERAKGIVQSEFNISEEEAYSLIQKQARSRRKSMKEIAEAILVTNDMKRIQKPAPSADELAS